MITLFLISIFLKKDIAKDIFFIYFIFFFFFFCSEGILIFPPNFAEHSAEKYEGHWEDGKMSGYGKMRWDFIGHLIFTPADCSATHQVN